MKFNKGDEVYVYAAFPERGAYWNGAEGVIIKKYWEDNTDVGGLLVNSFMTVKMKGSGDIVPVHRRQIKRKRRWWWS